MYKILKSYIKKIFVLPLAIINQILHDFLAKIKILLFLQRTEVFDMLGTSLESSTKKTQKILFIVTHFVSNKEAECSKLTKEKIEKLIKVIEGICSSFSPYKCKIIINTIPEHSIIRHLPKYLCSLIEVVEQPNCNPELLGFKAQGEFIKRINSYDWFIFLEDDIIINDGCFIDKLETINRNLNPKIVLIPNRFEICEGTKNYVDLVNSKWNQNSVIKLGNIKIAECQNPHSGIYCLSKQQLEIWIKSGRFWHEKLTFVGNLESAATGCLFECFSLYKPHPENLYFLEVQHWDKKYSQMYF